MKTPGMIAGALAALAITLPVQAPQSEVPVKEEHPGLLSQATIKPDSATRLALGRVPGGRVAEAEIEQEHGKLVYSFDISVAGKSGVEELQIDARTGAVVSAEHEAQHEKKPEHN